MLKDVVLRYVRMKGYDADYRPGWDCHGLPIELAVDKRLGKKKREMSTAEFRRACRAYAQEFIDSQREGFKRLGIEGRWDDPYVTMSAPYEASITREFGALVRAGGSCAGCVLFTGAPTVSPRLQTPRLSTRTTRARRSTSPLIKSARGSVKARPW